MQYFKYNNNKKRNICEFFNSKLSCVVKWLDLNVYILGCTLPRNLVWLNFLNHEVIQLLLSDGLNDLKGNALIDESSCVSATNWLAIIFM